MTPEIKWTSDCSGKWDYDGALISVSTRYWPSGGGFYINDASGFRKSTDGSIRPSATASIVLNVTQPDWTHRKIVEKDFEGDSETEVKYAVEQWVQGKFDEIVALLRIYE